MFISVRYTIHMKLFILKMHVYFLYYVHVYVLSFAGLYNNASDWPTAVQWNPDFEHHLYVGTQTGKVHMMDSRNADSAPLLTQQVFNLGCQVHKIQFNSEKAGDGGRFLAVCGDSSEVVLFNQSSVPSLARL